MGERSNFRAVATGTAIAAAIRVTPRLWVLLAAGFFCQQLHQSSATRLPSSAPDQDECLADLVVS